MENESDALPPIHINDLVAQLLESKAQAERGEGRPANEILAEMETRFQKRFPSSSKLESKPDYSSGERPRQS